MGQEVKERESEVLGCPKSWNISDCLGFQPMQEPLGRWTLYGGQHCPKQHPVGQPAQADGRKDYIRYQTELLGFTSWESPAGSEDASWEGRVDPELGRGVWDWEGCIDVAGKVHSWGAVQRWERLGQRRGTVEEAPGGLTASSWQWSGQGRDLTVLLWVLWWPSSAGARASGWGSRQPGRTFLYCI